MSSAQERAVEQVQQEILVLLRRVRRNAVANAAAVHPDLQAGPFTLLQHVVGCDDGARAADMCDRFGLDKGSVSRQVQSLVDLGLVDRRPDPTDGRAQVIVANAEGRLRMKRMVESRTARFQRRLADWTAADLADFAGVLARYNRDLSDQPEPSRGDG